MTASSVSAASTGSRERLLTPAFIKLSLADLAYFTAVGIAVFALPPYVTGPLGSDKAGAGIAFGAFAITALVLRPFAGRLSDTRGRRPLLVGGALLAAATLGLTAGADTLTEVIALRLVAGVAEAAFFVAGVATVVDLAPASRLGEAMSYNSLGLYLGLTLGPPLGEILVTAFGFHAAWYGAAILALLAAGVVYTIGETRPDRSEAKAPSRLIHRKAIPPTLGFLASVVAMGGFLAFASLYAGEVGLAGVSVPLAVYGSVVVICRIVFAKVPDRVPSLPLGAAALIAMTVGLVIAAIWATPVGLVAGAAVLALGVAFSSPAFFSAIFATASPTERGAASGTASAAIDLGIGGGPILLGLVAESMGIPWAFGVAAGVGLLGAAWTIALWRHMQSRATARA